jgi:hypothetical protein
MKSVLRYTAAGVALATFGFASAAQAATANADATAEILSTLQVTVVPTDRTLDFGDIADNGLVGTSTVTVSELGVRTCGANLTCSGTVEAPTFNVVGLVGSQVAVTFPSATAPLTYAGVVPSGMTGSMTVGTFTTSAATLNLVAGNNPFTIGGTLTVNPLQAPGVYTGTVAVEVQYN